MLKAITVTTHEFVAIQLNFIAQLRSRRRLDPRRAAFYAALIVSTYVSIIHEIEMRKE